MILNEIQNNLDEILKLLQECQKVKDSKILTEYLVRLKLLIEKFKYWKPEIFILYINEVETIVANCDIHVNIWDDKKELNIAIDSEGKFYSERKDEFEYVINSGINSGDLKQIF